jgi:hypothetical protein
MYKQYNEGNLFQINFGNGFGYIQEVGELIDSSKMSLVAMYERSFAKEIRSVDELSVEKHFVSRFFGIPAEECRGSANHPVTQTDRGSKFDYGVYKDNQTGELKNNIIYVKHLGSHPIPPGIEPPHYLRDLDCNFVTGTHRWIVRALFDKSVKQQKTVKGIERLPPDLLVFASCATWWEKGLTIESWNDDYCRSLIEEHFLEFPEDRSIKMSFDEVVETMPTKKWRENSVDGERAEWYSQIEKLLQQFIMTLSSGEKIPSRQVKKAIKELALALNKMQNDEFFIETMERDDLFTFISALLRSKRMGSAIDVLEEHIDW